MLNFLKINKFLHFYTLVFLSALPAAELAAELLDSQEEADVLCIMVPENRTRNRF